MKNGLLNTIFIKITIFFIIDNEKYSKETKYPYGLRLNALFYLLQ